MGLVSRNHYICRPILLFNDPPFSLGLLGSKFSANIYNPGKIQTGNKINNT